MDSNYDLFQNTVWEHSDDGFSLCLTPVADILNSFGIFHTGLSSQNPQDVQSYYDDWHLYRVAGDPAVFSLLKMREQEHDFVPGFADRDDPGVTISFVAFDVSLLTALEQTGENRAQALTAFVSGFRRVTEYPDQRHDPLLQRYFSDPYSKAAYLIAHIYIEKLLSLVSDGVLPFPEKMSTAPSHVLEGMMLLNHQAGRTVCDFENRCLRIADPLAPTREEICALLIAHTGNLSFNSFAAEVKFHADALISWHNQIPGFGKSMWYESAIRADMQLEPEEWLRKKLFSPYYSENSPLIQEQEKIHGKQ